jgi:type III secretory pathway component EscT
MSNVVCLIVGALIGGCVGCVLWALQTWIAIGDHATWMG